MAIAGNKLLNLTGAKALYDDLRARIGNIAEEDTATATAAHAVGDAIMVGTQLWRCTAAIAIGDTITDTGAGANVESVTVAELIADVPAPGSIIDDTAGDGVTDKVWSANKVYDQLALKAVIDDTAGDGVTNKVWSANKVFDQLALKATKANPQFSGAFSHQRADEATIGENSVAMGNDSEASGEGSIAIGYTNKATGDDSVAIGGECQTSGQHSVAIGYGCVAENYGGVAIGEYCRTIQSGRFAAGNEALAGQSEAIAIGNGVRNYSPSSFVFGKFNKPGAASHYPSWTGGKEYWKGDCVKRYISGTGNKYYICKQDNSDSTFNDSKWDEVTDTTDYAEIVGNGTSGTNRSNARTLDWSGNEEIAGTFKCATSITIGSTTITEAQLIALLAML